MGFPIFPSQPQSHYIIEAHEFLVFGITVKECEQIYLTNSVLAELVNAGFLLKWENWLEVGNKFK